jgi:hypothetical protein
MLSLTGNDTADLRLGRTNEYEKMNRLALKPPAEKRVFGYETTLRIKVNEGFLSGSSCLIASFSVKNSQAFIPGT